MDHSLFTEISFVIAIATLVGLVMRLLKQPLIIGYILTGIIVGPTVFNIVQSEGAFDVFAKIGIALLLFIVGLGINPKVIRELGKVSLIVGSVQIFLTALLGYGVSIMLGFDPQTSLIVGVALAFSSTIIILKLLSDKKEQSRLYGKIAIGILLVQDIVATIALLVLSAQGNGEGISATQFGELAIKGLLLAAVLIFFSAKVFPHINKLIAGSQEFLFLFALGWGLGIASLFEIAGFSIEVGALFAGVALAPLPYAQEVSAKLRPIRDFFIVLFFISLGAGLNLEGFTSQIVPILIITLVAVLAKPLIIMTILGFMGYTKNTSLKTGLTMGQISEFSLILIILAQGDGFISEEVVTIMTVAALVSIAISTYAIMYSDQIYLMVEKRLKMFEKRRGDHEVTANYSMILFGYQKGGSQFLKVFRSMHKKFIVVDYDPEVIDHLDHSKTHHIYGDATDPELLEEINITKAKLIISTITDHGTNTYLVQYVHKNNPRAVLICHADSPREATELYEMGATYVLMPHYLGSEKIGSFIKKNGFNKTEFKKYREKHLLYLESHGEKKKTTEE